MPGEQGVGLKGVREHHVTITAQYKRMPVSTSDGLFWKCCVCVCVCF